MIELSGAVGMFYLLSPWDDRPFFTVESFISHNGGKNNPYKHTFEVPRNRIFSISLVENGEGI